jgi:hypothetical protein
MEAIKDLVVGTCKEFLEEQRMPLIIAGVVILLFGVLAGIFWWRGRRGGSSVEGFEAVPAAEVPPEVAAPETEPMIQQENCDTIKKMRDALRLTELNPKMKEFVQSDQFKAMKSEADEKFRVLECEEYAKKIARGEIQAPQTSPDKGPELPAGVAASSANA